VVGLICCNFSLVCFCDAFGILWILSLWVLVASGVLGFLGFGISGICIFLVLGGFWCGVFGLYNISSGALLVWWVLYLVILRCLAVVWV